MNKLIAHCLAAGLVLGSMSAPAFAGADGKIGGQFHLGAETNNGQSDPSVAPLSDGGFVVIWVARNVDGSFHVHGQRYSSAGKTRGREFQVKYTNDNQDFASVAALSDGGFVVVWQSEGGIDGRRYDATSKPIGGEFRVTATTKGDQIYPSVAGLSDGGFVVVWEVDGGFSNGAFHYYVYGQRYDAARQPVGGQFVVNTSAPNAQTYPSVAALNGGGFVAAWDTDPGVHGQSYDSSGGEAAGEFQANTYARFTKHIRALRR